MLLGQLLVNGIAAAGVYALLAVGFALIYNATKILHIAHAVIYTFGAYSYYVFAILLGFGYWIAIPFAIVAAALFGLAVELGIYRPVRRGGGGASSLLVASVGTVSLIQGLFALTFTTDTMVLREGALPSFDIGGVGITLLHLADISIALTVFFGLQLFLTRSRLGTAIRALAENGLLAEAQGLQTRRLYSIIFLIGSALAGTAGILVSLDIGVRPGMGFDAVFTAIIAVIVGGVGFLPGALVGAFILALLQQLVVWKLDTSWQSGLVFFVLIVFLVCRPQGVFGARMLARSV